MPARIAQNFFQVKCLGCLSLGGPMGPGARQPASWSLVGGGVGQPREPSTAARKAGQQDDGEETKKPSGQGDSAPLAWRLLRGRRFASHSDKLGHTLTKHAIQLCRASLIQWRYPLAYALHGVSTTLTKQRSFSHDIRPVSRSDTRNACGSRTRRCNMLYRR
jgi:hypothetical protein